MCCTQVWVLDALPGSVAESTGPESRHRQDHPQDLIARLQVSDTSMARLMSTFQPYIIDCGCHKADVLCSLHAS